MELTEEYSISILLNYLKPKIEVQIRMLAPRTLMKAYSLVKLAEKSTRLQRGQWQKLEARNNKSVLSNPTPWSQDTRNGTQNQFSNQRDLSFNGNSSVKGSRRLTRAEIDEKRAKGLCYWCDEKFNLGHNYKRRKQLFIFEVDEDWEETDVEECSEGMAGQ